MTTAYCVSVQVQKMREEQEKLRKLLHDTVSMLCRNSLQYQHALRIEGVIGITVDDDDAFLVHINHTIGSAARQDCEYSQNIKLERGYTESPGVVKSEPVMDGFQSAQMPYSSSVIPGADSSEHISSTVFFEAAEIKPDDVMEEDAWVDSYEESYSDLAYPLLDTLSYGDISHEPRPAVPRRGRPRMLVCIAFQTCIDL